MIARGTELSTRVAIRCLGPVEVTVDGRTTTTFRTSKVPALLGYLALHPGLNARESVAESLWPDRTSESARQNLRQTILYVQRLFQSCPEQILQTTRLSVGLASGLVEADIHPFLLRIPSSYDRVQATQFHERIVANYGGPLLSGHYDDWVLAARGQIARTYFLSLLHLAEANQQHAPERALHFAELAVAEDIYDDAARALKIAMLNRLGRHAAARQEFESFARLLESELSLRPGPIVERAYENRPAPDPVPSADSDRDRDTVEDVLEFMQHAGLGEAAAKLGIALVPFWIQKGSSRLGLSLLKRAVGTQDPELGVQGLVAIAELGYVAGDHAEAQSAANRVIEVSPHSHEAARSRIVLAKIHLREMEPHAAISQALGALRFARKTKDVDIGLAASCALLMAHSILGKVPRVARHADRVIALAEQRGKSILSKSISVQKADALHHLGEHKQAMEILSKILSELTPADGKDAVNVLSSVSRVFEDLGELSLASEGYERCVAECRRFTQPFELCINLTYLGDYMSSIGNHKRAIALHSEALSLRRAMDQSLGIATSLRGLGRAKLARKELSSARENLLESAQRFRDEGARSGHASALLLLAEAESQLGSQNLALRLATEALSILRGLSQFERLGIGPSGATILAEAEGLVRRLSN